MRRFWRQIAFLNAAPLAPRAARYAAAFSVGMAVAGMTAGGIRLLPWVLDPSVSWRVTLPFARALAELALEAALLLGWPLGWSLAAIRLVETGESRVLALLGERPAATASRLAPQGIALSVVLAAVSLLGGRDASEPGRISRASARMAQRPASARPTLRWRRGSWRRRSKTGRMVRDRRPPPPESYPTQ